MAKIALVTSWPSRWRDLAAVTNATKKAYCDRWGYDFITDESDLTERGIPIMGFRKLDLLLHAMRDDRYAYVAWVDADALVTNPEHKIEYFVSPGITVGYDGNGHNTTVIIAHNAPLVRQYLHACNTMGRNFFLGTPWHEMDAMRYFAATEPYNTLLHRVSCKELCPMLAAEYDQWHPRWFTEPFGWEPGSWILHLPALPDDTRLRLAKEYALKKVPA